MFFLNTSTVAAATRVFYDGFESGTVTKWALDSFRDPCTVVSTAADGIKGPYDDSKMLRCNANGTVAWDTPSVYETLGVPPFSMNNEVLYRYRVRVDQNHDSTFGSTHKLSRIFNWTGDQNTYNDLFSMVAGVGTGASMHNDVIMNGDRANNGSLYWGDASGDTTGDPANWHTIEYYLNKATGVVKVWHDHVLVQNWNYGHINGPVGESGEYYITSNWEDGHDATNYVYFDNYEVFTDASSGEQTTGSLADGTVSVSGIDTTPPNAPTGLLVE